MHPVRRRAPLECWEKSYPMIRRFHLFLCAVCCALPAALAEPPPLTTYLNARIAAADAELEKSKTRLAEELETQAAALWKRLEGLAGKNEALKKADQTLRATSAAVKTLRPDAMRTQAEFDAYDRLVQQEAAQKWAYKRALAEHRAAVRAAAAKTDEGRTLLLEWDALQPKLDAARKEHDEAAALAAAHRTHLKNYTAAPPPPPKGGLAKLELKPPADAETRRKRFAQRNAPESIKQLARDFFSRIDLQHPGLEEVPALLAAGRDLEALEAWKRSFFARLQDPEKHGLPADWGSGLDTASWLRLPPPERVEAALKGVFSTSKATADVGLPGAIPWGDPGPDPSLDPEKNAYLDFYTTRGQGGFVDVLGPHLVLLEGYAATGDRRCLDRWAEVLDDWAMHAPDDMERSPYNIRQYPVLCSFRPTALASTLTDVVKARPEFAEAIPAPTIARVLRTVMEEYPAAFARSGRRGIYNWRCIATTGAVMTALAFPEFQAARRQRDEAGRLMELNWSHKVLRDGGNLEQANWGHEPNDQVHLGDAYRLLEFKPPAWLDDAWRAEWRDSVAVNARYYLHNLKPDGMSFKFARVATADKFRLRGRFDDPAMPIQTNLLLHEPESRRRLEWVFGEDGVAAPEVDSEFLPYLGAAVFRGGWTPAASFLYFQSSPNQDANGREDANGYALHAYGNALVLSPPLAVDGRTQDVHDGMVWNPGGKTLWLSYDRRGRPVESRFHASPRFDFAEGEYDGAYQWQRSAESSVFGEYGYTASGAKNRPQGDDPVRGVRHSRKLFSLRGEDLTIVVDRVSTSEPRTFSQDYTLFAPIAKEGWKRRLELAQEAQRSPVAVDAKGRSIRTDAPAQPGVSLRHFSAAEPKYTVTEDAFAKIGDAETVDEALVKLGSAKLKKWTMGLPLPFGKKVRVDWKLAGENVLVTAVSVRPAAVGGTPYEGDLRDVQPLVQEGAVGFRATTRHGRRVQFLAAEKGAAALAAGGLVAEGEAFLVVEDGNERRGVVLGCRRLTFEGRALAAEGDFEFALVEGTLSTAPIFRPLQPVAIEPPRTVFTETCDVALSCPTPGVEIRYTLDGSDPSPHSSLYEKPFILAATTRVKARAFRPGLSETPWTADGTEATAVSWTTFRKHPAAPAVAAEGARPGLEWEYLEGRWAQLFADVDLLPAKESGVSKELLDVSMRSTDGAFAVRASGFLNVPADGVYTFHAPHEFQYPDGECGYDLRIFVDGKEWAPATRRHAHGTWSAALRMGAHPFRVVFVDFRPKKLKTELWGGFPNPEVVWKGSVPTLLVAGPDGTARPLPAEWLSHLPPAARP